MFLCKNGFKIIACVFLNALLFLSQARLWVQIMRELRHGVRLKKVEQVHLPPVEFELTPFEILLEDIRLGRYKLNRIMVRQKKGYLCVSGLPAQCYAQPSFKN